MFNVNYQKKTHGKLKYYHKINSVNNFSFKNIMTIAKSCFGVYIFCHNFPIIHVNSILLT